jgi:aryl-alcohol dehydrogenase-like predicted oxidoreductase
MHHHRLGKSGLKVSRVILGAMGYGNSKAEPWYLPEDAALPLLEHAYKRGINTWDTADFYSLGGSESMIAKAIQKYNIPREHLVLMTKCYFGTDEKIIMDQGGLNIGMAFVNDGYMVNRVGLSRKKIIDAVENSVKR